MQEKNKPADEGQAVRESVKNLMARLQMADVVVLISSSEEDDLALKIETILPGVSFQPGSIASHAYAKAMHDAHGDLIARISGHPTDADRYYALRAFTTLPGTDPARFEAVNVMLQQYETDNPTAGKFPTEDEADRMADFLIHALDETTPIVVEMPPSPLVQ